MLESPRGLIAVEVKATPTPTRRDARHLDWLTRELGDLVHAGILLTAGPQPVQLADRVLALPISALWAT